MRFCRCLPKGIFLIAGIAALLIGLPAFAQQAGPLPPTKQPPPAQQTPPAQPGHAAPTTPVAPATPANGAAADSAQPAPKPQPATILIPSGTKLPLVLHNAVTTRNAQPGDPVYLETLFPIVINNKILVPAGSYVQGEIVSAKRPGKVKGTGELQLRLNTMILPNGYTVNFNAIPQNAGTGGGESVDKEGTVHGDSDKTTDAGTIVKGTAVGAGIGGIATRSAAGAGIGAGIGAAVGLAAVLLTRGPELELPRGTTLDVVIDRPVYLDASFITFTDPGHSSTLPGPPNREPTRSRSPF
jgi:type IV secretion system protein VirB10